MNFLKSSSQQTLSYLWSHIYRYRLTFIIIVSFISLAKVLGHIIYPLIYRELIDLISEYSGENRLEILDQLITFVIFLTVCFLIETIFYRVAGLFNNHFQPSIMRDISNDIFQKLHSHSVGFFANNFIGSLVTKSKRMIHGFERIMDILYWELLGTFIIVTGFYLLGVLLLSRLLLRLAFGR